MMTYFSMNRVLKSYLRRLTNLSSRNKSLLLGRLPGEQFADLHDADFLLSSSSFDILQFVIQRRSRIPLCDVQDPRYDKVNLLSKRLRKIARTANFIEEESGAIDLFVGYPFVRGKFSNGSVVHAPLLFFPVTLRIDKEQWCLFSRSDTGVTLNRSFALAYGHFNETIVPDAILETAFEEFPANPVLFRTEVYKWLSDSPFNINFNQKLFEDKLQYFEVFKSADLELLEKTGELKLYPEAVLGIFPQAGSYLEPDYKTMLLEEAGPVLLIDPNNEALVPHIPELDKGRALKEEHMLLPFPADASQESVIKAVKTGASVVVQGPPGTGKSQLICNLMADYAARGKRVLLVCQKRAALDVVASRLREEGLGDFLALIHDFRNDRGSLYRQIADQIDRVDLYKKENYSLDAVVIEREFTKVSRQIDQINLDLTEFRQALFDERISGVSIKELYLTSSMGRPHVDLQEQYRAHRFDRSDDFLRGLGSYLGYVFLVEENQSWCKRVSFSAFSTREEQTLTALLSIWKPFVEEQQSAFEQLMGKPFSLKYTENVTVIKDQLTQLSECLEDEGTFKLFKHLLSKKPNLRELGALAHHAIASLEKWDVVERYLTVNELYSFDRRIQGAVAAKQSLLSGLIWDWFSADKKTIAAIAAKNGLGMSSADLSTLSEMTARRIELEEWLQNPVLHFDSGHLTLENSFKGQYLQYFKRINNILQAVSLLGKMKNWTADLVMDLQGKPSVNDARSFIDQLQIWLEKWETNFESFAPFLLTSQLSEIMQEPERSLQYQRDLKDFESLVEMDRLWEDFSADQQQVVSAVIDRGHIENLPDIASYLALFENSVRLAWIHHIESSYPVLKSVSSLKMKEWEEQLQHSIVRKQSLSRDIALIKLRASIYEAIETNRLGNAVTYRELYHQVTKKKKIWPVRKLLEQCADDIFRLVPCWLASPESVSAMFPMEEGLFDLVIFDEASQCFAEYGLPAAFRAKQIVVTGDRQQLRPGDLYRIRFEDPEDEEETTAALEVESLLDLATQSLAPFQLTGHYRSRSLDLIDFSNRNFYKGTLRLLPDYQVANSGVPGISYIKVDGVWNQQTNEVEAEKVLALITALKAEGCTVGVVTFNFKQQALIQEMAERAGVTAPSLFIKNIENVQGDERDVIIFSVGYAPDPNGRLNMQFGSLNMQGGGNRLNVAVTRARRRIYVVTSLWPDQLHTEGSVHEGPGLLKSYLEYSLDVSEGKYRPVPVPTAGYRSGWMLKDKLITKDPHYFKELPFADITVRNSIGYEGLILTDDDLYHDSTIAKEPHAYLPLALMDKSWSFRRVFSRNYWLGNF